jgi:bifunctional pyridoxal-dependent enzyme with beta-cystathionase and maltose regulon repressor activities
VYHPFEAKVENNNREGRGFVRVNAECPLSTIKEGMQRIKNTLEI